jgi:hypothetical protein
MCLVEQPATLVLLLLSILLLLQPPAARLAAASKAAPATVGRLTKRLIGLISHVAGPAMPAWHLAK